MLSVIWSSRLQSIHSFHTNSVSFENLQNLYESSFLTYHKKHFSFLTCFINACAQLFQIIALSVLNIAYFITVWPCDIPDRPKKSRLTRPPLPQLLLYMLSLSLLLSLMLFATSLPAFTLLCSYMEKVCSPFFWLYTSVHWSHIDTVKYNFMQMENWSLKVT